MADHRLGQNPTNLRDIHHFEPTTTAPNRADLFLRSESPRVQQILLHQKLREDIEKNSIGRVRYVDSELHLRNNNLDRSPNSNGSEIQIATLNIGLGHKDFNGNKQPPASSRSSASTGSEINKKASYDLKNELELASDQQASSSANSRPATGKSCQVCLVKEVRQELMNINKLVQERNEQITKLKAKYLRSYFEKQMS